MTLGDTIKLQVEQVITNPDFRTKVFIIPRDVGLSTLGGYQGITQSTTGTVAMFSVPSRNIRAKINPVSAGDLREGEVNILVQSGEVIDTNDLVLFQGDTYHVRRIKPITFNNQDLAKSIILSRELNQ